MLNRSQHELKMESLEFQQEFLDVLRNRHLAWGGEVEDSEISRLHIDIVDLIQQIREKYGHLLRLYEESLE